ncbi:MAG: sugar ABC transporter permease [Chloroflexota bacterium]|nr:MAG: sugar ABC transporter permease [Chloroflexota bacterium]
MVGLANYANILFGGLAQVLSGFDFWRILTFNLVWTFVNLIFHVAIGVGVAVLLNQEGFKFKRFYRAFYIIPWAMPALVSAMIWRNMYDDQSGALNQLLRALGLPGGTRWLLQVEPPFPWIPPIIQVPAWTNPFFFLFLFLLLFIIPYFFRWVRERWLIFTIIWAIALEIIFFFLLTPILNLFGGPAGNAATGATSVVTLGGLFPLSFFAVLIANIWLGWPFMMAVATGALQSIPKDMYEAAEIDGATSWQSFWNVTVPLIRPAMIPAIIIGMTMTFNQFSVIYFISAGGPLHSTEILVTQAYRLVNEVTINVPGVGNVRPYGYAAAFAYIVFAVLATITLITNRITRATQSAAD